MSPATAHLAFWAATAVIGAAQGMILWSAIRRFDAAGRAYDDDRRVGGRRAGERWAPDRRVGDRAIAPTERITELGWAVLPAVALALLLAATWAALP